MNIVVPSPDPRSTNLGCVPFIRFCVVDGAGVLLLPLFRYCWCTVIEVVFALIRFLSRRYFSARSTLCLGVAMYGNGERSCIDTNGNVHPITARKDVPIAANAN